MPQIDPEVVEVEVEVEVEIAIAIAVLAEVVADVVDVVEEGVVEAVGAEEADAEEGEVRHIYLIDPVPVQEKDTFGVLSAIIMTVAYC